MAKILDLKNNLEQEIKVLISEVLETEPGKINPQAKFVDDLGMDSMMALEILASLEKKYKITIPEDMMPKFTSLEQTVSILQGLLAKKR
ncbi:MAG: acyl carrier protein [Candidatus Omnitrophota bacterium]|nr:acyl carrier protein [Candidatus Omnitrophota bacterium]